jgi:hypothetical protein
MTTLVGTRNTLNDIARRLDPDGKIAVISELLTQGNPILEDMHWVEGNLPTGHKTTIRTGLPSVTWRKLNYGVQPSKSATAQITDTCGMLETYAEVDKALAMLNGNSVEFRLSEDRAFLQSMNNEIASTIFYGDTAVNPERFMGFAPRFLTSSGVYTNSGFNIVKGSGVGGDGATLSSMWLVTWGPNSVHGIYPKGSIAGLQHNDLGEDTVFDANNGRFQALRTHYKWDCGLTVRDWRYVSRIANIKSSTLTKNAGSGDDLIDLMSQALEKIQDLNLGTPVFYVNRTIKSYLRRQIANKVASSTLTVEMVGGKEVMMFGEAPVKRCDALLNTESAVA